MLKEVSSEDNPVALLKAQWTSSKLKGTKAKHVHFKNPPAHATIISRGAVVRMVDKNFEPGFGLFNNAIGIVEEIVFKPGDDPNNGDLPLYVLVRFEHYSGPAWDPSRPKVRYQNTKYNTDTKNDPKYPPLNKALCTHHSILQQC